MKTANQGSEISTGELLDRVVAKTFDQILASTTVSELKHSVKEAVLSIGACSPRDNALIQKNVNAYVSDVFADVEESECLDPDHLKQQALAYTRIHFVRLYGGSDS